MARLGMLLGAVGLVLGVALGRIELVESKPVPRIDPRPPDALSRTDPGGVPDVRAEPGKAPETVPAKVSTRGGKPIRWRRSRSLGTWSAGSLVRGVVLPRGGANWVSWDPILKRRPSREWRRWGSDRLIRATLGAIREFARRNPDAPRVPIGDLSRPRGGDFGPEYGALGHASHQNGLDVDVYYPRVDRRVRPPSRPGQVDVALAQDLVDAFVAAGAIKVFVGPNLPLEGPPDVVVPLVNHDNHLHARLPLDTGTNAGGSG